MKDGTAVFRADSVEPPGIEISQVKDHSSRRSTVQLALILAVAIALAVAADQLAVAWLQMRTPTVTFRRIGPESGPQVFCAGSSLLQFGLSWPELQSVCGQGFESWGVAGSTPREWEVFQKAATNTDTMILGIDLYDLNEEHLCDFSANLVSLKQTIRDLWRAGSDWKFSKRVLSEYPLEYVRVAFPTAARSNAVLVALRQRLPKKVGFLAGVGGEADALATLRSPILDFPASEAKVSDWSSTKMLRRLSSMRDENRGKHSFYGPKRLALNRMLAAAKNRGRVIVVVLPVTPAYVHEFISPEIAGQFEKRVAEIRQIDPAAQVVRIDRIPSINSDDCFSDLVHLNARGRRIATDEFLRALGKQSGQ
jgi:hypothetical protein